MFALFMLLFVHNKVMDRSWVHIIVKPVELLTKSLDLATFLGSSSMCTL